MLKRAGIVLVAAVVLAAGPLLAQRGGMGMGMSAPSVSGLWNPTVGNGATYEITNKDGKKQLITFEVVGKEDSNGHPGYWLETLMNDNNGQQMVIQQLMVKDGTQLTVAQVIFQQPGRGPMQMSGSMMTMMASRGGSAPASPKADFREGGENVGPESVTTAAGTFDTEHWRSKDGVNAWISPKVGPWGVVKSASADSSMVLVKVVTDAKSHVVGTPQSMDSMMGRGRGQE